MSKGREFVENLFLGAVEAVQPHLRIDQLVEVTQNEFVHVGRVGNRQSYALNGQNVKIVGFGKAVTGMAKKLEEKLGSHLKRGILSVPKGSTEIFQLADKEELLLNRDSKIEVYEGAENNIPDEDAYMTSLRIVDMVTNLSRNDLLFVLVSGGGSALLPCPTAPITLDEKSKLIKNLSIAGATIEELNCVRKRISDLKGGKLRLLAGEAQVVTFILSDIIGDPLDFIASGPTVMNTDPRGLAEKVLGRYRGQFEVPSSIDVVLAGKEPRIIPDLFSATQNILIGNNDLALKAIEMECLRRGVNVVRGTNRIDGEAKKVADAYSKLVMDVGHSNALEVSNNFCNIFSSDASRSFLNGLTLLREKKESFCVLNGGETVVRVQGRGKGGRNQELVLTFASRLQTLLQGSPNVFPYHVVLLSAGTDGIDGPTDAAGAVISTADLQSSEFNKFNIKKYLAENDSYSFFSAFNEGQNLVKTGHTGTNVMDIHVLLFMSK